ncbi:hypothetical protein AALP_AA2G064200 [Arabis alpina]|uniref:RING-type E3 ubiquitin transferase n=1 Tax=Arabis alpina TaxID=50452 RepID=A0A087HFP3_ARAAL|nr:hypothetical protein AALP_AA2G064200 [Arabis alpina]
MVGASISESSGEGIGSSRKRQLSPTSSVNGTKKLSAMLFDLDSLSCPICFEVLTIPIFQCDNGHLACSSCCPKLGNKCPSCASPIGHNRCRAMETVLESVCVPCRNAKLGCTKKASYGNELTHEKECKFSLCSCPVEDCNYTALHEDLYVHYTKIHWSICWLDVFSCGNSFGAKNITDKILIQREYKRSLLFAVQCFKEPYGLYVTVSCIAPSAPEVGEFSYHLSYTMVLEASSLTPQEDFMLIPLSFLRGNGLEMEICIRELNIEYEG